MLVIVAVSVADHSLGGVHNHQHQIDPIVPVFNDQFSRGARQQNFFGANFRSFGYIDFRIKVIFSISYTYLM